MKLGDALVAEHIEIVQCWYETWCRSARTYPEIEEAALKDHLPVQLRLIGEQLKDLDRAVSPQMLWQVVERLDPEARVIQHMPIEEVVQEYGLVVEVIRRWIQARGLNVSFEEYSYLFQTLFELTAESVRRYSTYQAERVKQDRAHYLAGLAHQMRTPLSTLSMQLQMLGRDKQLGSAKVEQLQRNVKHLIFLMNGVMRLERFKPEELPVNLRRLYPAQLIDQVLDDRRLEANLKDLRLEVWVNRALEMDLDEELFADILGNLVDNAIKYTPRGFVRVEVEEEAEYILFKVQDSGPGISAEVRRELFMPTRSIRPGGLGIGLHIASRAVTALQGTLEVGESVPGEGALFRFRLPRTLAAR